jgi:hypothetical protein
VLVPRAGEPIIRLTQLVDNRLRLETLDWHGLTSSNAPDHKIRLGKVSGGKVTHTMQEPLPDRPASVSALTPAGERKEMTMNRATPGIIVGFAGLP